MKGHNNLKWLGGTRDDAAGECFDKTARALGLKYPGGPEIALAAEQRTKNIEHRLKNKLPRPMINDDNFDFSFSGLKTAVINLVKKQPSFAKASKGRGEINVAQMAHEIQEAITDVLVTKTIRAAQKHQVKSILLAGGVAANSRLREKLSNHLIIKSSNYQIFIPPPALCTDNAAYITACAYFNQKFVSWEKIKVEPGLRIC